MRFKVIKDSINPMAAKIPAYGKMNQKVSIFIGILEKVSKTGTGKLPFKPSPPPSLIKEPTVATSKLEKITIPETTIIAISASGSFFVAFIFGKIKRSGSGSHKSKSPGMGDEHTGDFRNYQFGDALDKVSITESIRNAQINNGIDDFHLTENDLVVEETLHKSQMSTVLMIDISHSMILYGEDRITPAKKVAMALAELITTRYPKDTLDIIVFGNDAWSIKIKDLPYLQVGPYHTNTVAGLNLAMDLLRRKRNTNKQIFMITDGKPSCLRLPDGQYYKNSNGLDPHIVNKCYAMAQQARKLHIPITTFMIAKDPYLMQFVSAFAKANQGKAFYTGLKGLGEMIFEDYETNRKKNIKG
ncbi:VWA domain-containing protein [Polaribacter sp.]|nr:VWA domain-containing protein [Polaribacter sp.]MDB4241466.1 VWA domain-containing protein [Polaribacter sp.]